MMGLLWVVMHRHSLVDISAFQWPFFSFESRDTTKIYKMARDVSAQLHQ